MKDPREDKHVPLCHFMCNATNVMVRKAKLLTNDYESMYDEDGQYVGDDTSNTDWENEYKHSHYTIPELLGELARYLKIELCEGNINKRRKSELKYMLADCEAWELEEETYEEG